MSHNMRGCVFRSLLQSKEKLHSTVSLSYKDTIHCSGTVRNDVNLNLTYFQPMGVVRLQFYPQAGRGTWKLMLSSVLVAESQLQIPPLSFYEGVEVTKMNP